MPKAELGVLYVLFQTPSTGTVYDILPSEKGARERCSECGVDQHGVLPPQAVQCWCMTNCYG